MGYDRGDSFPFDFEPNGTPFGSESKEKLSPRSYPIQCISKWQYSFLSVVDGMNITAEEKFPRETCIQGKVVESRNQAAHDKSSNILDSN